jgi:hypothetical protein
MELYKYKVETHNQGGSKSTNFKFKLTKICTFNIINNL